MQPRQTEAARLGKAFLQECMPASLSADPLLEEILEDLSRPTAQPVKCVHVVKRVHDAKRPCLLTHVCGGVATAAAVACGSEGGGGCGCGDGDDEQLTSASDLFKENLAGLGGK